jgi:hypothetical protein
MKLSALFTLGLTLAVAARPARRASFTLENGQDAIALNNQFQSLTASSPCQSGENACVGNSFAQCDGANFVLTPCPSSTICAALPLINSPGTSIACTTQADLDARIAATGAQNDSSSDPDPLSTGTTQSNDGGSENGDNGDNNENGDSNGNDNDNSNQQNGNDDDSQTSLTLDPAVIADGFASDGQDPPVAGQVASLTSTNNFINFCNTVSLPITNGQQITSGSCNPAPMGTIPSTDNMPSSKFTFPKNLDTIKANQSFTIQMAIKNLETGNFVNADQNYFAAPQQLNGDGQIKGHSHVVIEKLSSIHQTEPNDPNVFAFFKGLNDVEQGGILTAAVDQGLPEGAYKLSSINTASNHQPCLVPIAQHGSLDDVVYFTVTKSGKSKS